ncbi:hypothetical protein BH11PSE5_BH11PSE5_26850 [soil metagenome]
MRVWHAIGRQLGNPQGLAGAIMGRMMRLANDRPSRLAVAAMGVKQGDSILDMGFGPGHAIELIAATARVVHGIDQSDAMLLQASCRNRKAIAEKRVTLATGSFATLPYPNDWFDGILASNVAYFWHDEHAILSEIRRVLKPGGRLCIYVTDAATMKHWRFADGHTHRHIDAGQLTDMLLHAGFDPGHIDVQSVPVTRRINGIVAVAYAKDRMDLQALTRI